MSPPREHPDSDWFRAAVDQYEGPLVRYAARVTGDLDSARDVVQDTFLRLCRASRAEVDGHLAQWLYTVCRRRALDVRRKEDRMTPMTDTVAQAAAQPAALKLQTQEAVGRALALLAELPDNQQEVVRLKFQAGLSYKEIAAVTSLSVSNVGYLLHTALRKLRDGLAE